MPEAPEHAPAQTPPRPAIHPTVPWERFAIAAALFVYVLYQVNAILHHGSYGQDFSSHLTVIARAYIDPWKFWTTYTEGQNNPPLYAALSSCVW